ncbi:DJ-1/PfpI family protein [Deinococcus sonorensis]|uniref:DJ-1/PfpI family protein n=2 Tax=Deinococcus sonorensis TaxID=309891 RepID=A0AAU7U5T1_9DEIO
MNLTLPAVLRRLKYPVAFLTLPLLVGVTTALAFLSTPALPPPSAPLALPRPPALDPDRPTVAVVLGRDLSEVADVLAPFSTFQAAHAFNVVTVAETRAPVALTGDLDVLPHFTFAQLDAQLGRAPDVIVVPNIPNVRSNEALRRWVQRQGQRHRLVMSVCAGAEMLAATGLLDGRPATTHWGDIARIERQYPAVRWVRGQRYVDDGQVISTAGILSGIDGALHVIARLRGPAKAVQAARTLPYEARYLSDPAMPQFRPAARDAALTVLNLMYRWDRPTLGVALQDGADDLALAALYDTVPAALAGRLVSVAPAGAVITTRSGLQLLARRTPEQWGRSGPLLFPGAGPADVRFPFDAALADLARRTDRPTAHLAAKRLEVRTLVGSLPGRGPWRSPVVWRPVTLGAVSLTVVILLEHWLRRRRAGKVRIAAPAPEAGGPAPLASR